MWLHAILFWEAKYFRARLDTFPSLPSIPLTNKLRISLPFVIIYAGILNYRSQVLIQIKWIRATIFFNEKVYSKLKLKEISISYKSQICIFIIDLHVHAHTGSKCKNIFLILDHGQNCVSSSAFHSSIHHHHSNPSSQQISNEPLK